MKKKSELGRKRYSYAYLFKQLFCKIVAYTPVLLLSACASTEIQSNNKCPPSLQPLPACRYFPGHESGAKARNEEWVRGHKPRLGLALAGGGTRAAQASMGILKGLNEAGVLKEVDVISSVSGGGYAAYWYFSRLLTDGSDTNARDQFFADCVPREYEKEFNSLKPEYNNQQDKILCPGKRSETNEKNKTNVLKQEDGHWKDPYRFQDNIKTHIDLFSPQFNIERTGEDRRFWWPLFSIGLRQIFLTLVTEPLTDLAFDWNVDKATEVPGFSSRLAYREGIQEPWGWSPVDCGPLVNEETGKCLRARPPANEIEGTKFSDISFRQLREAYRKPNNEIPFWILNATTPVLDCDGIWYTDFFCTWRKWWNTESYPPHKAGFEITPYRWGSGEHGYWPSLANGAQDKPADNHGLNVVEAVSAAAAFFDPNEKTKKGGGILNALQQAFGLKWGYYIPNPVTMTDSPWQWYFHRLLPFPLYFFQGWQEKKNSVDIHLIDGGQHEDLGAVALIRRRIPNIIISDHASEKRPGSMEDICNLKRWLRSESFAKVNNGRIWEVHFDQMSELDKVCEAPHLMYNLYTWKNPVMRGCAAELELKKVDGPKEQLKPVSCDLLKAEAAKTKSEDLENYLNLYIIKPALNLSEWTQKLKGPNKSGSTIDEKEHLASDTELLGFLINNVGVQKEGGMLFPRHCTVALSIDSSPWLFGAYRELAARSARKLKWRNDSLVIEGEASKTENEEPYPSEQVIKRIKELTEEFKKERDLVESSR